MQLQIEITEAEHQTLKTQAQTKGLSVEQYMLERSLPGKSEDTTVDDLDAFLGPRVASARNGKFSNKTVEDIFNEVIQAHAEK